MGQSPSTPEPGRKLQVIGAGLPRTGTASFSEALSILLKGPIYHGGTQVTMGRESNIVEWMNILKRTPTKSAEDRKYVNESLSNVTAGYVGITDTPGHLFIEELMELYPDAKVICTVRDPDAWAESIDKVAQTSLQGFLTFSLLWLPGMRHFPNYLYVLNGGRWSELYGPPDEGKFYIHGRQVWDRHMAYLKRVVPKEKLVFFDVRDGWETLCEALDVPVPKDMPFPKINDGQATEEFAKKQIQTGLLRWAVVFGVASSAIGGALWFYWN